MIGVGREEGVLIKRKLIKTIKSSTMRGLNLLDIKMWLILAFLLFNFVTTEIFLRFGESNMLSQNWIVLTKGQLIWSVHRIFLCVILTNPRLLRDQTNEFALSIILLCHNTLYFITLSLESK